MSDWIFQSNPKHFNLPAALKEVSQHDNLIEFLVTRYINDIAPGDTVYVCFGGQQDPGLYAKATCLTHPSTDIVPAAWQEPYATPGPHPWMKSRERSSIGSG
jgi:hypothetical protein